MTELFLFYQKIDTFAYYNLNIKPTKHNQLLTVHFKK